VNELIGWYAEAAFPSAESNRYALDRGFFVETMTFDRELPQAAPGSPLCHVSIARWCEAAGIGAGTPERAERCACLCGDVAAKAVELLNAWKDGAFIPMFAPKKEAAGCAACHAPGKDAARKQTSVGKMQCLDCHSPHDL